MKRACHRRFTLPVIATCCVLLNGCSGESSDSATSPNPSTSRGDEVTRADASRCKVTLPNGKGPPGETLSPTYHRQDGLFTVLKEDGIILARPSDIRPDGTVAIKFPWWADGPEGPLAIRGRRVDGQSPPLRSEITPSVPETGFRGTGFWATSVIFPTEGCWEVTGTVDRSALHFVTFVLKA